MKKLVSVLLLLSMLVSGAISAFAINYDESNTSLFNSVSSKYGDCDFDDSVTIKDASLIQKHAAGLITLSDEHLTVSDVDGNGRVNIIDATFIQKWVASIVDMFPVESNTNNTNPSENTEPVTSTAPATEVTTTEATDPTEVTTTVESTTEDTTEDTTEVTTTTVETTVEDPTETTTEETTENTTTEPATEDYKPIDTVEGDFITQEMLWTIEEGFYRLVNEERTRLGLEPLAYKKGLDDGAQIRSKELITNYSHTRPDGSPCYSVIEDPSALHLLMIGENIYGVYGKSLDRRQKFTGTQEELELIYTTYFNGFKNSPGHYANMIDKDFNFAGIGISYVYDKDNDAYLFYISHIFGKCYK